LQLLQRKDNLKRIAIFASGSGTNAENIMRYFEDSDKISVEILCTNNKNAKAIDRALNFKVPVKIFTKEELNENSDFIEYLSKKVDYIILAGFLWLIPKQFIKKFPNKIINIHPALLPKYGGKGMYGMHVHEAVVKNKEKETGITIHFVDEKYDEGAIIFQHSVTIFETDSPEDVASKIHQLEYEYFPKIIESVILQDVK